MKQKPALQPAVEEQERDDLPEGWTAVPLMELCQLIRGVSYEKGEAVTQPAPGLIPLLRANNIDGELAFRDLQYVPARRVSQEQMLCAGDVVLAMSSGSKTVVGKAASVRNDWHGTFGAFCGVLRPSKLLHPDYFGRFFSTRKYRETISEASAGVNINNLKREYFEALEYPLAPSEEQQRIVAKFESLLARVSSARERLAKVPKILKSFRQSVLAAACSGRLTEDWREGMKSLPSAHALLQDVLSQRQQLWHAECMAAGRNRKYVNPIVFDQNSDLPAIPEAWTWTSADSLCSQITDGEHIQPPYRETGLPMLTAKHVRDGYVVFDDAGLVSDADFKKCLQRCAPTKDDILIVSVGATTGRAAIVEKCPPFAIVRSVLLLRPLIEPRYFLGWIHSPWCFNWMQSASGASAQPHLYINDTRRMPVPLPTLQEQKEIVRRVEALFKLADAIEKRVDAATKRADKLTQSILAKAFRGELVSTEAELARKEGRTYEPASELLARIRAEREKSAAIKPTTATRKSHPTPTDKR